MELNFARIRSSPGISTQNFQETAIPRQRKGMFPRFNLFGLWKTPKTSKFCLFRKVCNQIRRVKSLHLLQRANASISLSWLEFGCQMCLCLLAARINYSLNLRKVSAITGFSWPLHQGRAGKLCAHCVLSWLMALGSRMQKQKQQQLWKHFLVDSGAEITLGLMGGFGSLQSLQSHHIRKNRYSFWSKFSSNEFQAIYRQFKSPKLFMSYQILNTLQSLQSLQRSF